MTSQVPSVLSVFCDEIHPRLVGALTLYVGDQAVAEELAQEALLRLSVRWDRVSGLASPEAWVHRVGLNLANSWFRRRRAGHRAQQRMAALPAAGVSDPDDAISVRRAVAELPSRQRAAIVLRYFVDLPVQDVAALLGVSSGAVRMLTHRGLAALAVSLHTELHDTPEDTYAH